MTPAERIKAVLLEFHIKNASELGRKINVDGELIRNIMNGRTKKMTADIADGIYNAYPVDYKWLMTGDGEMKRGSDGVLAPEYESFTKAELIRIIRMQASKLDELRIQSENNKKKGISKLRLAYFKMFIHYQKLNKSLSN